MKDQINYNKLFENNPKAFSFMEPFLGEFIPILPINEDFKVLDIGCFQGANLLPFVEFGCENVYGIDKERAPLVSFANNVYKEYGKELHSSLNLNVGEIEKYNFPKSLDLIIAFRVMQHLTKNDSIKIINKIKNATSRNGYNLFILWEDGERYDPNLGYFGAEEICLLYDNWEILECERKKIKGYSAIYFAARKKY